MQTTGDTATEVDDLHSLLNDDTKSGTFTSQANTNGGDGDVAGVDAGGAFRSPQPPTLTQNVTQPGSRSAPVQQNMVASLSPRMLQQPSTPGSVGDSPYSQHHAATTSPSPRQLTTPSPMGSPVPNAFQQPQKHHEIKMPSTLVKFCL